MKKIYILIAILIFAVSYAQHDDRYVLETDPLVLEKIAKWQDLKFGLLMHWGPYSQWGVVESWSICAEDEGWCRRNIDDYALYKEKYEKLKNTFNPVKFDPDKWATAAADAGMKYMVFTTKHHDGFSMFDTKLTDYKISAEGTPFSSHPKANITKELFNAFRDKGLWVGAYFSKPDWHSPYYWWPNFATPDRNVNYDPLEYPEKWQKFVDFTHGQINELTSEYGKVDILWLDGGWVAKMSDGEIREWYKGMLQSNPNGFIKKRVVSQDIKIDELAKIARKNQPGILVVDRAVYGKHQNYLTPENRVPDQLLPYPWESCIIAGGGWSWVNDPKFKSPREVIHLLVDIVSKGGNLLLNIAPSPEGTWHGDAYKLLNDIGKWMAVNDEAIYSTKPIEPYKEGQVRVTKKDGAVYAIYLGADDENGPPSKIWLSSIQPKNDAKLTLLGTEQSLQWEKAENGVVIEIPDTIRQEPPCDFAWVVKISTIID